MKQLKEQSCLLALNRAAQTHLDQMLWMCVQFGHMMYGISSKLRKELILLAAVLQFQLIIFWIIYPTDEEFCRVLVSLQRCSVKQLKHFPEDGE